MLKRLVGFSISFALALSGCTSSNTISAEEFLEVVKSSGGLPAQMERSVYEEVEMALQAATTQSSTWTRRAMPYYTEMLPKLEDEDWAAARFLSACDKDHAESEVSPDFLFEPLLRPVDGEPLAIAENLPYGSRDREGKPLWKDCVVRFEKSLSEDLSFHGDDRRAVVRFRVGELDYVKPEQILVGGDDMCLVRADVPVVVKRHTRIGAAYAENSRWEGGIPGVYDYAPELGDRIAVYEVCLSKTQQGDWAVSSFDKKI